MTRSKLLPAFVLLLSALSCEKENPIAITDGSVYAELTAVYNESAKRTYATASFWEGGRDGKRVIFNGGALLYFQDAAMDYRTSDYSYIKEIEGYHSPVEFSFTDINNRTFTNSSTVNYIGFPFGVSFDTLDMSSPLTLAWLGTPVGAGETVWLTIDTVSAKQDLAGSTAVTFSQAHFSMLAGMKNTAVTLTLERLKQIPLTQDLGGSGLFTSLFVAETKSVYLK